MSEVPQPPKPPRDPESDKMRDAFASRALPFACTQAWLIKNASEPEMATEAARLAYRIADAMLRTRRG